MKKKYRDRFRVPINDPHRPVNIYGLYDMFGRCWYIGQTVQSITERFRRHITRSDGAVKYLTSSIKVRPELICIVEKGEAYRTEKILIQSTIGLVNTTFNSKKRLQESLRELNVASKEQSLYSY